MVQGTIGSVVDKSKMFKELTEKNKARRVAELVDAVAVAHAKLLDTPTAHMTEFPCDHCSRTESECICHIYDEHQPD